MINKLISSIMIVGVLLSSLLNCFKQNIIHFFLSFDILVFSHLYTTYDEIFPDVDSLTFCTKFFTHQLILNNNEKNKQSVFLIFAYLHFTREDRKMLIWESKRDEQDKVYGKVIRTSKCKLECTHVTFLVFLQFLHIIIVKFTSWKHVKGFVLVRWPFIRKFS